MRPAPRADALLKRLLRAAAIDVRPLRTRGDFRLLWIGLSVSFVGTMITEVAVPYQVYQLTHSSLLVGLLGAAEFLPLVAFAFAGGALADARDRRALVLGAETLTLLTSALLLLNAVLPHPQVWALFAITGVRAAVYAFKRPALDSMLPRLVSREEVPAAVALSSLRSSAGMIGGPALGGVLIAAAGIRATYLVDVLTFAVSLTMLVSMRAMPAADAAARASLRGIVDGLRYARGRPELMGTYLIDIVAMFFGMPIALFPAIATQLGGPAVLGLMYAAPAVGSLAITLTSGWTRHVHRHGLAIILAASGWGLAIVLFGLTRWLPLALLFLAAAGAGDMVSGLFRTTVWNQTIPDHLRGRLASIEMLSYSTGPMLGSIESGGVAALFGARFSVISGGAACVAGCLLFLLVKPFRDYDSRTSPAGQSPRRAPT